MKNNLTVWERTALILSKILELADHNILRVSRERKWTVYKIILWIRSGAMGQCLKNSGENNY